MSDVVPSVYAVMKKAAISQAAFRGLEKSNLSPEADVRAVWWWRVRGLWRAGKLLPLLGVFGLDAGAWVLSIQHPDKSIPVYIFLLPLLTVVWLAIAFRSSRRAWKMAREARKVPSHRVRYVLLHSYASEAPWLVFFSLSGGEDDEPFGAVPLRYGPLRDRYRQLPSPVGEARLTGNVEDGSIVVPWISGQPVWPSATFRGIDMSDALCLRSVSELVRPE